MLEERWDRLAQDFPVGLAISAGVCGALDPALRPGALVIPERVLGPTGEASAVSPDSRETLGAHILVAVEARVLATSTGVLVDAAAKAALRARTGAGAVDMESAAILSRATRARAPALVVRAVSDAAHETVPVELVRAMLPDGRLDPARAAVAVASPRVLRQALRLLRGTRLALAVVAAVLAGLPTGRT